MGTVVNASAADVLRGAMWLTAPGPIPPLGERPAYEFRRSFDLSTAPREAVLAATAHGIYEAFLNGVRVGDEELTPGATSYAHTLYVQRFDVAPLLRAGTNELRLVLSDGWFRGRCGPRRVGDNFGTETSVVARLEIEGEDGPGEVIVTDTAWQVAAGTIVAADLMDGQRVDLRRVGAEAWLPAQVAADPLTVETSRLAWSPAPPVRRVGRFPASSITGLPSGRQVVDFGQNLNGWVRLGRLGPAGTTVTLTHGEALTPDGDLTLANLDYFQGPGRPVLGVGQQDKVISRGVAEDVFEPRHTTHGFRYVAVDGLDEPLTTDDIVAIEVRSDLAPTGTFECGDDDINALHHIVLASWRANSCDLPTDCPQRERWGYTGDIQIFVRSAVHLEDVSGFLDKWLRSLADDQHPDGLITTVAPDCGTRLVDPSRPISFDGSAGWGDAATIVPWELYRAYGNPGVLEDAYPMMKAWVDRVAGVAERGRHPSRAAARPVPAPHERYLWDTGWQWGEWMEPGVPFDHASDKAIIATAYFAKSAGIVADSAELLGHSSDAVAYRRLHDDVVEAWRTEFLLADGRLTEPTQANYARALAFGLIPEELRAAATDRLVELVEEAGHRLTTGFLGTGLLLPVLAENGRPDVAYRLLFQRQSPGWLNMLDRGATTIWESWDGIDADGVAHDSLNHYAKGAVITFLHEYIAGIQPASPGYSRIRIQPHPHPRLGWARGALQTVHGEITNRWELAGNDFTLEVTIPAGTTAAIHLPDGREQHAGPGTHRLTCTLAGASSSAPA